MNRLRPLLVLFVVFLCGAATFWVARITKPHAPAGHEQPGPHGEVAWMKTELGLNEEQFRKVVALHVAYIPRCEENCCRIREASARVMRLLEGSDGMNEDLAAAIREEEKVRADCRLELTAHLYETAAVMPPEARQKFLNSAMSVVCGSSHPDVHGAVAR